VSEIKIGLQQRYRNVIHRLKERRKWYNKYYNLKYFKIRMRIQSLTSRLINLSIYSCLIILFVCYINRNPGIIDNFSDMPNLIFQQISMTLLVMTVVSLLANLDNKYIYGEKAIEILFAKKGLFSVRGIFNSLILAMLFNLALLINGSNHLLMISCFLFSVWMIVHLTFKFTNLYTNPEYLLSTLKIIYLDENEKHLRKAKPLETNKSKKLEKFKNITLQYIKIGDVRYSENIEVYCELLKVSLFNNKNMIQEYYTESITYSDLIAHLSEFSANLLQDNRYNESIEIYKTIYNILNYYEVVLVHDMVTNGRINGYIEVLSLLKNNREIQDFHFKIFQLVQIYFRQLYLYTTIDLSYCRLDKLDKSGIYYFTHNEIFENYYCAITSNKNLTDMEKGQVIEKLYDKIRMLKLECETNYAPTHTNFLEKVSFNLNKIEYPNYLYAEPITLMLIKIIECEDWDSFELFLSMNLDPIIMYYIRLLCLSSVLEALNRGKAVYYLDLVINSNQIKETVQMLQLKKIKVDIQQLCLLYSNFISFYVKGSERKTSRKYVYSFHPRLSFSRDIIDTLFNYLAKVNNLEKEFQYICSGNDTLLNNINELLDECLK